MRARARAPPAAAQALNHGAGLTKVLHVSRLDNFGVDQHMLDKYSNLDGATPTVDDVKDCGAAIPGVARVKDWRGELLSQSM